MIKAVSYHAADAGPRLLILGGVHGNEICGPQAIGQILPLFESGEINLTRGSVTFVPVANPEAFRQDKRFIAHNLNRRMRRHDAPALYEEKLMNVLCPYLEACDLLLDIHSYSAGGPPFAFRGPDSSRDREEPFAAALGIGQLLYGWEDAYIEHGTARPEGEAVGTTEYARRFGAAAITLECGQHRDPACVGVARRAIMGALHHSGTVAVDPPLPVEVRKSRVRKVVFKAREGGFARPLAHLEAVSAGTVLARYLDGEEIVAPWDSRLIMPKEDTAIGHEWLYLAADET